MKAKCERHYWISKSPNWGRDVQLFDKCMNCKKRYLSLALGALAWKMYVGFWTKVGWVLRKISKGIE